MRNTLTAAIIACLAAYGVIVSVLLSRLETRLSRLEQNLIGATRSAEVVVRSLDQKVTSLEQQLAMMRTEMVARKMFNPSIRDLPPQGGLRDK